MSDQDNQLFFIEPREWWEDLWDGMPEFIQEDLQPVKSLLVHFEDAKDMEDFSKLVNQPLTFNTKSIWYPQAEIGRMTDKVFESPEPVATKYPIYIVSKGRWENGLTTHHLQRMGIPHYVIVEEQEAEKYAETLPELATIVILDKQYQKDYDIFEDSGNVVGTGSGPARNFAWDHSISLGAARHWTVDDNIDGFYRLYKNIKTPCSTGAIFRAMEDFVDRYENVGMAGPNYFMFASRKAKMPPLTMNTRIYSCNLIKSDMKHRWRGRYNEDTDLSLRILKDGLSTVLFNAFLQMKMTTQTMKGGNTDSIYQNGTLAKSEMLAKMHPDVAEVVERWGRVHHYVDYRKFKDITLIPKKGFTKAGKPDEFGMSLRMIK